MGECGYLQRSVAQPCQPSKQRPPSQHDIDGLLLFLLVCGIGAIANVGIARQLYADQVSWTIAGALGAVIGVVWNYAVSATLVWRVR